MRAFAKGKLTRSLCFALRCPAASMPWRSLARWPRWSRATSRTRRTPAASPTRRSCQRRSSRRASVRTKRIGRAPSRTNAAHPAMRTRPPDVAASNRRGCSRHHHDRRHRSGNARLQRVPRPPASVARCAPPAATAGGIVGMHALVFLICLSLPGTRVRFSCAAPGRRERSITFAMIAAASFFQMLVYAGVGSSSQAIGVRRAIGPQLVARCALTTHARPPPPVCALGAVGHCKCCHRLYECGICVVAGQRHPGL